jgi:type IV pilus assembly protein PilC
MVFSSVCPLPALVAWCRALRHGIGAGLSPVRVLRQQAKSGPAPMRATAADVADRMEKGDSFEDALEPFRDRFPPMFLEMVAVGEKTGRLEDTFRELEDYYETAHAVRKDFRRQMMYPAFQYVAAVFIISLLLLVLGFIADVKGGNPIDPLGLGLTGATGAAIFFCVMMGGAAVAVTLIQIAANNTKWRAQLEAVMLWVPGWGPALKDFALHRFCVALRMTNEAGMKAAACLRYALRATANARFQVHEKDVVAVVKKGDEMAPALRATGAFPDEFLEVLVVGEETGNIAEVMGRMGANYAEDAARKMKIAAQFTSYAVYGMVAIFIIICIFRIAGVYVGAINAAAG